MASITRSGSLGDRAVSAPEPSDEVRGAQASGAVGPGLVSPKTSDSRGSAGSQDPEPSDGKVTLFRHEGRLKRMRRSVQWAAELIEAEALHGGRRCKAAMITPTYAPEIPWNPRHITGLVKCIRGWCTRRGFRARYVWVLELTQAGRPHYHLLVWLPRGLTLPKPDKQGWWPYGSTRIEWARSAVGYLVKYASKGVDGDELPKGARLSGCGGLSLEGRCVKAWRGCPAWVREIFTVEDRPKRAEGGGWLSRRTGAFEAARWRLVDRAADWSWLTFEPVASCA